MTDWNTDKLVAVNDQYDRENASDGHSRYGAYLRQNANLFRDAWTDEPRPVQDADEFAAHAWTVATGPIMAPGYVQVRPDLRRVTLHQDENDGSLYADIVIPLRHHHITRPGMRFPYTWQDWQEERYRSDEGGYAALFEPDPGKRPAVLTTTTVRIPGWGWGGLPVPSAYEGPKLVDEAREAVSVIAGHINHDAGPIVALILGGDA